MIEPWITVYYRKSEHPHLRVGYTLPKFVGTAVTRNRIRRWCRESVRRWKEKSEETASGLELSFVFRRKPPDFYKKIKHEELTAILEKILDKIV